MLAVCSLQSNETAMVSSGTLERLGRRGPEAPDHSARPDCDRVLVRVQSPLDQIIRSSRRTDLLALGRLQC